jgi:small subunit ribosomal protein S9
MYPGSGSIEVNGKEMTEYFGGRGLLHVTVLQPLVLTEKTNQYDIIVKVVGGGTSGQAGAVRHGIARALTRAEGEELRGPLKSAGLLTRDARVKERKKVGLKRARKAPQYTKR